MPFVIFKICRWQDEGNSSPTALFRESQRRKEITELFFEEVLSKYDVFVSELVHTEIEATPNERLRNLCDFLSEIENMIKHKEKEEM